MASARNRRPMLLIDGEAEYPCTVCTKNCDWGQHSILCDACNHWVHRKCIGYTIFEYYALDLSDDSWECPSCVGKESGVEHDSVPHLMQTRSRKGRTGIRRNSLRKCRNSGVSKDMKAAEADEEEDGSVSSVDNSTVSSTSAVTSADYAVDSSWVSSQQNVSTGSSQSIEMESTHSVQKTSKPADGGLCKGKRQSDKAEDGATVPVKKKARLKRTSSNQKQEKQTLARNIPVSAQKQSGSGSVWTDLGVFKCEKCGFTTSQEPIFTCHTCSSKRQISKSQVNQSGSPKSPGAFVPTVGHDFCRSPMKRPTFETSATSSQMNENESSAPSSQMNKKQSQPLRLMTSKSLLPKVPRPGSVSQRSLQKQSSTPSPQRNEKQSQPFRVIKLKTLLPKVSQHSDQRDTSPVLTSGQPRASLFVSSQSAVQSPSSKTGQPSTALPVESSQPSVKSSVASSQPVIQSSSSVASSQPAVLSSSVASSQPAVQSSVASCQPAVQSSSVASSQPAVQSSVVSSQPAVQSSVASSQPAVQSSVASSQPAVQSSVASCQPAVQSSVASSQPAVQSLVASSQPALQSSVALSQLALQSSVASSQPAVQSLMASSQPAVQSSSVASFQPAIQSSSSVASQQAVQSSLETGPSTSVQSNHPDSENCEQKFGYIKYDEAAKKFHCLQCGYSFVQGHGLFEHLSFQQSVNPYNCAHCKKGFPSRADFQAHFATLHPGKKIECELHKVKDLKKLLLRAKETAKGKTGQSESFLLHPEFRSCIKHTLGAARRATKPTDPGILDPQISASASFKNGQAASASSGNGHSASVICQSGNVESVSNGSNVSNQTQSNISLMRSETSATGKIETSTRTSCERGRTDEHLQNNSSSVVSGQGLNSSSDPTTSSERRDSGEQEQAVQEESAAASNSQCAPASLHAAFDPAILENSQQASTVIDSGTTGFGSQQMSSTIVQHLQPVSEVQMEQTQRSQQLLADTQSDVNSRNSLHHEMPLAQCDHTDRSTLLLDATGTGRSAIYSPISPAFSSVPSSSRQVYSPISPAQTFSPISPEAADSQAAVSVDSANPMTLPVSVDSANLMTLPVTSASQHHRTNEENQAYTGEEIHSVSSSSASRPASSISWQNSAVFSTGRDCKPILLTPSHAPVPAVTSENAAHSSFSVSTDVPAASQFLPNSISHYFVKFHTTYACLPCAERYKGRNALHDFSDHVWSHFHPEGQRCNECSNIAEKACFKARSTIESISSVVDISLLSRLKDAFRKKISSKLAGSVCSPQNSLERADSPDLSLCQAQMSGTGSSGQAVEVQASESESAYVHSASGDSRHEPEAPASCLQREISDMPVQREEEVSKIAEQSRDHSQLSHLLSPAEARDAEAISTLTTEPVTADMTVDGVSGHVEPQQCEQEAHSSSSTCQPDAPESISDLGHEPTGSNSPDNAVHVQLQPEEDSDFGNHGDQTSCPEIDQNIEEGQEESVPSGASRTVSTDSEPNRVSTPGSDKSGPGETEAFDHCSAFYICSLCRFSCVTAIDFTMHLNSDHHDATSFPCHHCNYLGQYMTDLTNHMNDHTCGEEKIFRCPCFWDGCAYRNDSLHNMKQHMGAHEDAKTFKCFTCESCFADSKEFLQHAGQNSITLYMCKLCGSRFVEKAAIQHHWRTEHTGGLHMKVLKILLCLERKLNNYKPYLSSYSIKNSKSQSAKPPALQASDDTSSPDVPVVDTESAVCVPALEAEKAPPSAPVSETDNTSLLDPETDSTTYIQYCETENRCVAVSESVSTPVSHTNNTSVADCRTYNIVSESENRAFMKPTDMKYVAQSGAESQVPVAENSSDYWLSAREMESALDSDNAPSRQETAEKPQSFSLSLENECENIEPDMDKLSSTHLPILQSESMAVDYSLEENASSHQDPRSQQNSSRQIDSVPSDSGNTEVLESQECSVMDEHPQMDALSTAQDTGTVRVPVGEDTEREASVTAAESLTNTKEKNIRLADLFGGQELHSALSVHLYNTNNGQYSCAICGKSFRRLVRVHEHLFTHYRVPLLSCLLCPYECGLKREMKRHIVAEHPHQTDLSAQSNGLMICKSQLLASLEEEKPLTIQKFRIICCELKCDGTASDSTARAGSNSLDAEEASTVRDAGRCERTASGPTGKESRGTEVVDQAVVNDPSIAATLHAVSGDCSKKRPPTQVETSPDEKEACLAVSLTVDRQLPDKAMNCGIRSFNRSKSKHRRSTEGNSPGASGEQSSPVNDSRKIHVLAAKPYSSTQYMPKTVQNKPEMKGKTLPRGTYRVVKEGATTKLVCKACGKMTLTPVSMSRHLQGCSHYINSVTVSEETNFAASLARQKRAVSYNAALPCLETSGMQRKTVVAHSDNQKGLSDSNGSGFPFDHSVQHGKYGKKVERLHSGKKLTQMSSKDTVNVRKCSSSSSEKSNQITEYATKIEGAKIFDDILSSESDTTSIEMKDSSHTAADTRGVCANSADDSNEGEFLLQRTRKERGGKQRLDSSSNDDSLGDQDDSNTRKRRRATQRLDSSSDDDILGTREDSNTRKRRRATQWLDSGSDDDILGTREDSNTRKRRRATERLDSGSEDDILGTLEDSNSRKRRRATQRLDSGSDDILGTQDDSNSKKRRRSTQRLDSSSDDDSLGSQNDSNTDLEMNKEGDHEQILQCKYCEFTAPSSHIKELEEHLNAKHKALVTNLVKCGHCGQVYALTILKNHISRSHPGKPQLQEQIPCQDYFRVQESEKGLLKQKQDKSEGGLTQRKVWKDGASVVVVDDEDSESDSEIPLVIKDAIEKGGSDSEVSLYEADSEKENCANDPGEVEEAGTYSPDTPNNELPAVTTVADLGNTINVPETNNSILARQNGTFTPSLCADSNHQNQNVAEGELQTNTEKGKQLNAKKFPLLDSEDFVTFLTSKNKPVGIKASSGEGSVRPCASASPEVETTDQEKPNTSGSQDAASACKTKNDLEQELNHDVENNKESAKRYRCVKCDQPHSDYRSIYLHLNRHLNNGPHLCAVCCMELVSPNEAQMHYSRNHPESSFNQANWVCDPVVEEQLTALTKASQLECSDSGAQKKQSSAKEPTKENQNTEKENPSAAKENQNAAKENPSAAKENQNAAKENSSAGKENPITSKENMNVTKDNQNASMANHNIAKENQNAAKENPSAARENQNTSKENQSTEHQNQCAAEERPTIEKMHAKEYLQSIQCIVCQMLLDTPSKFKTHCLEDHQIKNDSSFMKWRDIPSRNQYDLSGTIIERDNNRNFEILKYLCGQCAWRFHSKPAAHAHADKMHGGMRWIIMLQADMCLLISDSKRAVGVTKSPEEASEYPSCAKTMSSEPVKAGPDSSVAQNAGPDRTIGKTTSYEPVRSSSVAQTAGPNRTIAKTTSSEPVRSSSIAQTAGPNRVIEVQGQATSSSSGPRKSVVETVNQEKAPENLGTAGTADIPRKIKCAKLEAKPLVILKDILKAEEIKNIKRLLTSNGITAARMSPLPNEAKSYLNMKFHPGHN